MEKRMNAKERAKEGQMGQAGEGREKKKAKEKKVWMKRKKLLPTVTRTWKQKVMKAK